VRVLVIDDNDACAFLLSELVKSRGCESLYCTMPIQAIDTVKKWQPNVILLDLLMPGIDGYQLAPKLREVSHGTVPRIFLVSGYLPDREKLSAATIDGYLLKPVRFQHMTDLLQAVTCVGPSRIGVEDARESDGGDFFCLTNLLATSMSTSLSATLASSARAFPSRRGTAPRRAIFVERTTRLFNCIALSAALHLACCIG
jgi:CheY-like chemotaxis protein